MSASRFIYQRRAHVEGSLNKVQNSNTIMTTQSPYRGVLGCGPRSFAQLLYFQPRCNLSLPCKNVTPNPPSPPSPVLDLVFTVSGIVWNGTQGVAYNSIHMYLNEVGETVLDYYSGTTVVFSTTV